MRRRRRRTDTGAGSVGAVRSAAGPSHGQHGRGRALGSAAVHGQSWATASATGGCHCNVTRNAHAAVGSVGSTGPTRSGGRSRCGGAAAAMRRRRRRTDTGAGSVGAVTLAAHIWVRRVLFTGPTHQGAWFLRGGAAASLCALILYWRITLNLFPPSAVAGIESHVPLF